MDILVIGNGFDLAHGLKTSYKDFLQYCITRNSETLPMVVKYESTFIDNIWLKHFITKVKELGNNWINLEQEIYNVIQSVNKTISDLCNGDLLCTFPLIFSIKKEILQFNFNDIINHLKPSHEHYNTGQKKYINLKTNDFSSLHIYIENYAGLINFLYDQLREFTNEFKDYLTDKVLRELSEQSKYQLSLKTVGIQPQDKDIHVLSFNYTNTCEKLYKQKFNTYCELKIKPVYIHGNVCNSDDCNLVLGTHSFNNKETHNILKPIPVEFNIFKKHNQRHKYGTIETYQDFLKKLTDPTKIINPVFHVIGHSLDKTDHNILKHVFLANNNAVIKIYYHNEEAQERLINNITDIIGEEEVMTRVRMIYQHDKKRGILIEKINNSNSNIEL